MAISPELAQRVSRRYTQQSAEVAPTLSPAAALELQIKIQRRDNFKITAEQRGYQRLQDETYVWSRSTTRGEGTWNIIINPRGIIREPQQKSPPWHEGFNHTIKLLQDYHMFEGKDIKKKEHDRNTHFFAANWNTLVRLFYPEGYRIPQHLPCYTEVDFGSSIGEADVIGVGPDKRLFIFEFGKGKLDDWYVDGKRKSTQVCKFHEAAQELYLDTFGLGEIVIAPYVAYYDRDAQGEDYMMIHPPRKQVENMRKYRREQIIYERNAGRQ